MIRLLKTAFYQLDPLGLATFKMAHDFALRARDELKKSQESHLRYLREATAELERTNIELRVFIEKMEQERFS